MGHNTLIVDLRNGKTVRIFRMCQRLGQDHIFAITAEMLIGINQRPGKQVVPGHDQQIIVQGALFDAKLDVTDSA